MAMKESSKKTTDTVAAKAPKTKATAKAADKTKASSKKAPSKKTTTTSPKGTHKPPRSSAIKKPSITPEERWKMISDAAYYIAEKRGFQNNNPEADWLQAEAQIDATLMAPKNKPNAT
jgi:hypothetical protein